MKSLVFLGILAVATGAPSQEVFKYEDEETKQMHFMSGEPGTDVEGGFQFQSPEGQEYKLTYKANDMGFQPEAEHLPEGPEPVDDTVEVKEAKSNFYSLYKEMEKKLEEVAKEDKLEEEQLVADEEVQEEDEAIVEVRKRRETEDLEDQIATEAKDDVQEVAAAVKVPEEKKMPQHLHHLTQHFKKYPPYYYHPYNYHHHLGLKPNMKEGEEVPEMPVMEMPAEIMPATMKDGEKPEMHKYMPHYYHPYHYYHHQKYFGKKPNMKEGEEGEDMPEMPVMVEEGAPAMPHYYHPYFHYYHHQQKHHQAKQEETAVKEEEEEGDAVAATHPGPYLPYIPYYHHPYYNPYFYYVHHKKEKMPEEKPGSFYPFYFAKPTMEDVEEASGVVPVDVDEAAAAKAGEEEAALAVEHVEHDHPAIPPCKHLEQILEQGQHFPYPPFYYPPISHFPVVPEVTNEVELKVEEDAEAAAAKTVSFPVYYHSYFPKYRYNHYKKPVVAVEEIVDKVEEEDVVVADEASAVPTDPAEEIQEEKEESRKKREAQFAAYPPGGNLASYYPGSVHVIRTVVRLAKPSNAEETGEEVVTSPEEIVEKVEKAADMEDNNDEAEGSTMKDAATTTTQEQQQQPLVPVYYPQPLPVVTRVHVPSYQPVQATYPQVGYPAFRYPLNSYYPLGPRFVPQPPVVAAAAAVPAAAPAAPAAPAPAAPADAAPLPETQFPIFPKPETEEDEVQAALAF